MARPAAMEGGLHGPFTHWHPNGAPESHGPYVEVDATSTPDGVWGFWYPSGQRRSIGQYQRGQPVGCFALWDEQGNQVTGVVEGEQLRIESCEPPSDEELRAVEKRSLRDRTEPIGDLALQGVAGGGTIGARNATQRDPDPRSRAALYASVRRYVGRFRLGPAIGLRFSDSDVRAYTAAAVLGVRGPSIHPRLETEIAAELGVQYLEVGASRRDTSGLADVGLWSPLGAARLTLSLALTPTIQVTGGMRVEGAPGRDVDRVIRYCDPICGPPTMETWRVGGAAYGVDVGLRLLLR